MLLMCLTLLHLVCYGSKSVCQRNYLQEATTKKIPLYIPYLNPLPRISKQHVDYIYKLKLMIFLMATDIVVF